MKAAMFLRLARFVCVLTLWSFLLQGCVTDNRHEQSCRHLEAAVRLPNHEGTYFFSEGRYLKYSEGSGVEKETGSLERLGFGNLTNIDAVFTVPEAPNLVIVASGQNFFRYNTTVGDFRRRVGHGNLREDLGLPGDIDAGFGTRHKMTVFKGCRIWTFDVRTRRGFEREDQTLSNLGIPCNPDSALTWYEDGPVVLIKDHLMWKLYREDDGVDEVEGPFHTDDLNICSWFLCGEANFTRPASGDGVMACNGDPRLCPLRLDQITWPGLHNAGAGFDHGFGFLNCWVLNHDRSIYEQLKLGIRHLDIDPCYDRCGYLGTCHSYFCGGSICAIIKQTRRFLLENPDEVVTVNFNHEILEPRKVFRELTRQLKAQLRPMLNSAFRKSSQTQWPTVEESILRNRRLFVIYAYIVENEPYATYYRRNNWIHSEHRYGSTWREIELTPQCAGLVTTTESMCYHRQYRQLVEVSTVITPGVTNCINDMAESCRPRYAETLKVCEAYRFSHDKSPNVLLVDFPEVDPGDVTSVFHAVNLQNVRNILQHRPSECKIVVDAAVTLNNKALMFSGERLVLYDFQLGTHTDIKMLPFELHHIDAAYTDSNNINSITVIKGCTSWQIDPTTFSNLTQPVDPCERFNIPSINAAVFWKGLLHFFQGCSIFIYNSSNEYQPLLEAEIDFLCDVDAVMTSQDDSSLHVFKANQHWSYVGDGPATMVGHIKDWDTDVVQC